MPSTMDALEKYISDRELPPVELRREIRVNSGLTLADVAVILGVTRQAVSWWERGLRTPRGPNLVAYSTVLRGLRER